MENTHIELINKFLEKKLSESEKGEFKTLFERDEKFSKEVKIHLNMMASIKAAQKVLKVESNLHENKSKIRKINWYTISAVAALVLVFIVIGMLIINNQKLSNEEIIANYYSPLEGKETIMGEVLTDDLITSSFDFYASKDYENALRNFDLLDDTLLTYRIFTGICNLELQKFSEALIIFKEVSASESIFINDANWYLAMTYLKLEQIDEAMKIFEDISSSTSQYKEKAEDILKDF